MAKLAVNEVVTLGEIAGGQNFVSCVVTFQWFEKNLYQGIIAIEIRKEKGPITHADVAAAAELLTCIPKHAEVAIIGSCQ